MKGLVHAGRWSAAIVLATLACGETSRRQPDSSVAGRGGVGGAGAAGGSVGGDVFVAEGGAAGRMQGEAGEPSIGGSGIGGIGARAGSAGGPPVDPCSLSPDGGSIVSNKSDFGNPGWANSFFVTGCKVIDPSGYCTLALDCTEPRTKTVESFPVGGCPGRSYKVKFRFSGVVEPKRYATGSRDAGEQSPANKLGGIWDSFHRDGEPVESDGVAWKLTVVDHNGEEARHYFLNSFPDDALLEGNTLLVQFEKTIVIVGGGSIRHEIVAPRCRAIDNCGPDSATTDGCAGPRIMAPPDSAVMLPAYYRDASTGMMVQTALLSVYPDATLAQPWHSQVGKLTVLSLELADDPVTTDYP